MKAKSSDIHVFITVADSGSFSEAARLLDVEVARCSRAVKRLEQSLGESLFTRTTRRIELTREGHAYLGQVRSALQQLEYAEQLLSDNKRKPSGLLRIDAATPFHLHQIVPHIQAFRERYPDIDLELSASENFIDLIERKVDVAIRIGALADSSMHATYLGNSPLHIVASPDYLLKTGYPSNLRDLEQHTKVGFMHSDNLNTWPIDGGKRITPDLAVSSGEIMRELLLQGNGLGCLSNFMVADDLKRGRLVKLFADDKLVNHPREQVNAVYYQNTALSPRIRVFLDFFKNRLQL